MDHGILNHGGGGAHLLRRCFLITVHTLFHKTVRGACWGRGVQQPFGPHSKASGPPSSQVHTCSRLARLAPAPLFPQLQPTPGTWGAEAGRMCAVGKGGLNVTTPT